MTTLVDSANERLHLESSNLRTLLSLIKQHAIRAEGSGSTAPCILNICTRWRGEFSFTLCQHLRYKQFRSNTPSLAQCPRGGLVPSVEVCSLFCFSPSNFQGNWALYLLHRGCVGPGAGPDSGQNIFIHSRNREPIGTSCRLREFTLPQRCKGGLSFSAISRSVDW